MEVVKLGEKFFSGSPSSDPNYEIIAPSDNVGGVIIRRAVFKGSSNSRISTGTARLTGGFDYSQPILMYVAGSETRQFQYPIHLPAGYGLWVYSIGGEVSCAVTYDLL